jgi:hypothetical protein
MDKNIQNDTKGLTSKIILSPLECPVCWEYSIGIKIYVCGNGHSLCENCHPLVEVCPTCNGPLSRTRNYALEQIAEAVVVPCPFAENGCSESVTGSEYQLHKSTCDFG